MNMKWMRITRLVLLLLLPYCAFAQTTIPPQFFGMHLLRWHPWPSVPFGSLRLWDTDTRWQQMNPESGVYDFSSLDAYLSLAKTHDISDVVLVLSGTPHWISSDPGNSICDYADFAAGSCAPPADLNPDGTGTNQAWRTFISQLATHVSGLSATSFSPVTTFEMWNEFSRNTESWIGTNVQMQRMAQDAFCILKGSGTITATGESCTAQNMHVPAVGLLPGAKLLSPSAQAAAPDISILGQYLADPMAANVAGAVATHDYTYGDSCCARAETLLAHWNALRAALTGSAANLPAWSTEGSWGDTATQEPDPDLQSAYVARAHLLGWAVGYKRMYWYAWGNSWGRLWSQSGVYGCSDGGSGTGCKSQAAFAYATVYSWMVGNTMTRPCSATRNVYTCELTLPNGAKTLAVWDASQSCFSGSCSYSSFMVPGGYTIYLDLSNVRHTLRNRNVRIGAKPILLLATLHASQIRARNPREALANARKINADIVSAISRPN